MPPGGATDHGGQDMDHQAPLTARMQALSEPEERVEGALKVTGRARYTADFHPPGMLWARYLLSPHPHARIRSIDATEALSCAGVHAARPPRSSNR